jgi:methylmalonyl-CoA carboxyltransferase large subunit
MQKMQQKSDESKSKSADSLPPAETVESLRQEIRRLSDRIGVLEIAVAGKTSAPTPVSNRSPEADVVGPEVILAISAAIAAYLGVEPHIRQIRLLHSHPWGQQGRVTIQASHRIHASH